MSTDLPFSIDDMITPEEARRIANDLRILRADTRQFRVRGFLAEADRKIREAAANGRNSAAWNVGTNEFEQDILRALRGRGFTATFQDNQFVIEWS